MSVFRVNEVDEVGWSLWEVGLEVRRDETKYRTNLIFLLCSLVLQNKKQTSEADNSDRRSPEVISGQNIRQKDMTGVSKDSFVSIDMADEDEM